MHIIFTTVDIFLFLYALLLGKFVNKSTYTVKISKLFRYIGSKRCVINSNKYIKMV